MEPFAFVSLTKFKHTLSIALTSPLTVSALSLFFISITPYHNMHRPIGLLHLRAQYWEKVSFRAASDSACKGPCGDAADASESHIPLVLFAIAAQVQPTAPREEM